MLIIKVCILGSDCSGARAIHVGLQPYSTLSILIIDTVKLNKRATPKTATRTTCEC